MSSVEHENVNDSSEKSDTDQQLKLEPIRKRSPNLPVANLLCNSWLYLITELKGIAKKTLKYLVAKFFKLILLKYTDYPYF